MPQRHSLLSGALADAEVGRPGQRGRRSNSSWESPQARNLLRATHRRCISGAGVVGESTAGLRPGTPGVPSRRRVDRTAWSLTVASGCRVGPTSRQCGPRRRVWCGAYRGSLRAGSGLERRCPTVGSQEGGRYRPSGGRLMLQAVPRSGQQSCSGDGSLLAQSDIAERLIRLPCSGGSWTESNWSRGLGSLGPVRTIRTPVEVERVFC
jgi:hypothetical protein